MTCKKSHAKCQSCMCLFYVCHDMVHWNGAAAQKTVSFFFSLSLVFMFIRQTSHIRSSNREHILLFVSMIQIRAPECINVTTKSDYTNSFQVSHSHSPYPLCFSCSFSHPFARQFSHSYSSLTLTLTLAFNLVSYNWIQVRNVPALWLLLMFRALVTHIDTSSYQAQHQHSQHL